MAPIELGAADAQANPEVSTGSGPEIHVASDVGSGFANSPERPPALDAITILKSVRGIASKRIVMGQDGVPVIHGFNAGWLFSVIEAPVSTITSLSTVLKVVETHGDCLIIRGAPRNELDMGRPQRRKKTNFETPSSGRRWLFIDIDKIHLPDGMSLQQDIGVVCEHMVGLLPSEFHQATYHWQLSSSAGVGDSSIASLHLWFWLDRPIPDASLKAWSKHCNASAGTNLIDPALFNDVQAHYTAAPIFEGLDDPFPVRSGLTRKAVDEVALKLPRAKKTPVTRATGGVRPLQASGGFETILAQIGDHPGGQGFHKPIIRAAASYAASNGRDGTDIDALFAVIRARVLTADCSQHDAAHVEQMASREHIMPAIRQALVKYTRPNDPRRKARQIRGIKPHFTAKPMAAAQASAMLKRTISGFFGQRQ